jgi:hypothetical protein
MELRSLCPWCGQVCYLTQDFRAVVQRGAVPTAAVIAPCGFARTVALLARGGI